MQKARADEVLGSVCVCVLQSQSELALLLLPFADVLLRIRCWMIASGIMEQVSHDEPSWSGERVGQERKLKCSKRKYGERARRRPEFDGTQGQTEQEMKGETYLVLVEVDTSVGVVAEEFFLEASVASGKTVRAELRLAAAVASTLTVIAREASIVVLPFRTTGSRGRVGAIEERGATLLSHVVATRTGCAGFDGAFRVLLTEVCEALIVVAIGTILATRLGRALRRSRGSVRRENLIAPSRRHVGSILARRSRRTTIYIFIFLVWGLIHVLCYSGSCKDN